VSEKGHAICSIYVARETFLLKRLHDATQRSFVNKIGRFRNVFGGPKETPINLGKGSSLPRSVHNVFDSGRATSFEGEGEYSSRNLSGVLGAQATGPAGPLIPDGMTVWSLPSKKVTLPHQKTEKKKNL
jgi:hypothetical protein